MALLNKIFKRKSPVSKETQSLSGSWALVRTSSKDQWSALRMPFSIGYHSDNDVFVNAPSMRQISKIVTEHQGRVLVVDAQNQSSHSIDTLNIFGIQIQGPYSARPDTLAMPIKAWETFKGLESEWIDRRFAAKWKKWLPKTTELRLLVSSLAIVGISTVGMGQFDGSKTVIVDQSDLAISVQAGSVHQLNIQSMNSSSPNAKGALFEIKDAKSEYAQRYVLTLNLAGLDLTRELEIYVNDSFIGHTTPSLTCIEKYCERDFVVNADILKDGTNLLRIKHSDERSSWGLKHVFFRGLEPATLEEIELGNQLLSSIERFYDERHLTVKNLRSGVDASKQLEHLIDTRTGMESLSPRLHVVNTKLLKAFEETSGDLQFKLQKSLKLGSKVQAKAIVDQLMQLYPEATMAEYQQLARIKSQLLEDSK